MGWVHNNCEIQAKYKNHCWKALERHQKQKLMPCNPQVRESVWADSTSIWLFSWANESSRCSGHNRIRAREEICSLPGLGSQMSTFSTAREAGNWRGKILGWRKIPQICVQAPIKSLVPTLHVEGAPPNQSREAERAERPVPEKHGQRAMTCTWTLAWDPSWGLGFRTAS